MFERYTEKARRVIFYARYEASEFGAPTIDAEHLLLALLREDRAHLRVYMPLAESTEAVRGQVEAKLTRLERTPASVDQGFSAASIRVLFYSAEEADRLGHKHIGTEHMFLALLREEKCVAAEVMQNNGAGLKQVRKAVAEMPPGKASYEEEGEASEALGNLLRPKYGDQAWPMPPKNRGFEAMSPKARRAVFHARQEAVEFGAPYIESEHLLLGLMGEGKEFLELFFGSEAAAESVRREVETNSNARGKAAAETDLPLSNECKRALAYGAEEAERLCKEQIGVEHLLLGMLRETGSFGAQMMIERGADLDRIRAALASP